MEEWAGEPEGFEEEARKPDSKVLLDIVNRRMPELFRDEEGEVHLAFLEGPDPPHVEVWPVKSRKFLGLLNVWFWEEMERGAREEVRREVVATLEAEGLRAEQRELSFYCLVEEDPEPHIIVDLFTPEWEGVRIDPAGMMKIHLPPRFRRFEHLGPLWEPEIPFGGEPREVLLDFLRRIIPEPEDPRTYDLLAPALPCLILPIPRPILTFLGGHGSGKSFAQRMIARVFLPQGSPSSWGDLKDLVVVAKQNPLLLYDNLGKVREELARFLSVCVTGERIGVRELYTDQEAVYHSFRRAILLNGIAPNIYEYPDLMDRVLLVKLRRIPEEKKRPEAELEREAESLLPRVFSACLEALRRALSHLSSVREELRGRLPRMADFAEWGEAVARGMGYRAGEWFELYLRWIGETVAETVEASPLGRGILRLAEELRKVGDELLEKTMEEVEKTVEEERRPIKCRIGGLPTWVGTPTDLLEDLKVILAGEAEEEGFPRAPQTLGVKLRELASSLQDLGVEVGFRRVGRRCTRLVLIQVKRSRIDNADNADNKPPIVIPKPSKGEEEREGKGETIKGTLSALSACLQETPREKPLYEVTFLQDYPGGIVPEICPVPKGTKLVLLASQAQELRRRFGWVEIRRMENRGGRRGSPPGSGLEADPGTREEGGEGG